MLPMIIAGFVMGNGFVSLLLFGQNQLEMAMLSAGSAVGQTGYTTVYRDPNGPGPDGKRFVGRRNYTIVSGKIIDQTKGFEI